MVTTTINVRSTIHSKPTDTDYYLKFNVNDYVCSKPRLTVYFEDTDYNGMDKFLDIYYKGSLIASCGSNTNVCGYYKYCLENQSLPSGSTMPGDQVVIRLQKGKGSGIPQNCTFSLWADVTLSCDALPCVDYDTTANSSLGTHETEFDTTLAQYNIIVDNSNPN